MVTLSTEKRLEELVEALNKRYFYKDCEMNGEYPFIIVKHRSGKQLLFCSQTHNLIPTQNFIEDINRIIEENGFLLDYWWYEWRASPRFKSPILGRSRLDKYTNLLSLWLRIRPKAEDQELMKEDNQHEEKEA